MNNLLCLVAALSLLPTAAPAPADARFGYHWQPAYSIDKKARPPLEPYTPQVGDIFLYSDTNLMWTVLYLIGRSLPVPGHCGIVIRMDDGQLGVLEAGYNDTPITKITPLQKRLAEYPGTVWIRQRKTPLSAEQTARMTEFADQINGRGYAMVRFAMQLTPIRSRGILRTRFLGKSKGTEGRYMCAEAVIEALIQAGLIDAETARPAATFPRDMFFDKSPIPYISKHLNLGCHGWEVPAMWRKCPTP